MSFPDDWLKNGLPNFSGGKDRTIARKMINHLGGPTGFKTSMRTNADGSVTTVQLKGDMPPQITTTLVETGCPHGLYYNGVVGLDVGGITVTGGQVRKDNGVVVQLPGNKPVLGNAVTINGVVMSGAKRRICGGSEYGKTSWPVAAVEGYSLPIAASECHGRRTVPAARGTVSVNAAETTLSRTHRLSASGRAVAISATGGQLYIRRTWSEECDRSIYVATPSRRINVTTQPTAWWVNR